MLPVNAICELVAISECSTARACLEDFCVAFFYISLGNRMTENAVKVIPLTLFYYQTLLKLDIVNIHDMNIKKIK